MAWVNPFKRKKTDEAAPDAPEVAPQGAAPVFPRSAAACAAIEQEALLEARAAELRASSLTTVKKIDKGRAVYTQMIAELTNPDHRDARALGELIQTFVPNALADISHREGNVFVVQAQAAKGSSFADASNHQEVFRALQGQIAEITGDLTQFVSRNLAVPGSVQQVHSMKELGRSTMVEGEMSRTVYADVSFALDREKLTGYSEQVAAKLLKNAVGDAPGFEVRPRGKDRAYAIDIRGNDPTVRRKLSEKFTALGVPFNSGLHYGRTDAAGAALPFDAAQGDIRYTRVLMPPRFAEQVDMLKDINQMVVEVQGQKSAQAARSTQRNIGHATERDVPRGGRE